MWYTHIVSRNRQGPYIVQHLSLRNINLTKKNTTPLTQTYLKSRPWFLHLDPLGSERVKFQPNNNVVEPINQLVEHMYKINTSLQPSRAIENKQQHKMKKELNVVCKRHKEIQHMNLLKT